MLAFRRLSALAFVCLASLSAAQQPDQIAAGRVLGPHWEQLSRSAGMVFSGTVLTVEALPAGKGQPLPIIQVKFRVDRAIAGVQPGQEITIREWAGAWSSHRAMRRGQRLLLFLYAPSRLGLTSPVGGSLGQVALDGRGEIAVAPNPAPATEVRNARQATRQTDAQTSITLRQLEQAIRSARNSKEKE